MDHPTPRPGPVEPPPTPWELPSREQLAALESDDDLVAVGADLAPGTLLAAYRRGLFPMPEPARLRSFDEVVAACADPRRPGAWIDRGIREAYGELHRLGWAHSVEAWQDGRLAGGLYGVAIGGLFAGESMFHHVRDASKVALVGLVETLAASGADGRLVDVQWSTPHLASLGVEEVTRRAYVEGLPALLATPLPAAFEGSTRRG